jgi:hypothetical protein
MSSDTPSQHSRFLLGEEIVTVEGARTWLPPEPVKALNLPDDVVHIVREGDSFFHLAASEYAGMRPAAALWWAIADYQTFYQHPLAPMEVGRRITLPSPQTIEEIILSEDRLEVPPQMLAALRDEEGSL